MWGAGGRCGRAIFLPCRSCRPDTDTSWRSHALPLAPAVPPQPPEAALMQAARATLTALAPRKYWKGQPRVGWESA